MFKIAMEVDAALSAAWPAWRMPRGNLVHSLVRSFVGTCIRTTGQSQRVAAARAAARAVAARSAVQPKSCSAASSVPVKSAASVKSTGLIRSAGLDQSSGKVARPVKAPRPVNAPVLPRGLPVSEPAFARVSSRRGAQPATANPVRIYSTPSRTVMVGNLSEVARLLDKSIERERTRLTSRTEAVIC
jgi:hypothetical protein